MNSAPVQQSQGHPSPPPPLPSSLLRAEKKRPPRMPPRTKPKMKPILKIFLEGLYDEGSNLSKLRGCEHIIKAIWTEIRDYYQSAVIGGYLHSPLNTYQNSYFIDLQRVNDGDFDFHQINERFYLPQRKGDPGFPAPSGININMMPFISSEQFEDCRLPEYLNPYRGLITYCLRHEKKRNPSSTGKVFYLSIEESEVEVGLSQRQPGLHVDRPGLVNIALFKVSFWGLRQKQLWCSNDNFILGTNSVFF